MTPLSLMHSGGFTIQLVSNFARRRGPGGAAHHLLFPAFLGRDDGLCPRSGDAR